MGILGDVEFFELEDTHRVECTECDRADRLDSLLKQGSRVDGIQVGKDDGESGWEPVTEGWRCPDCRE